MRHWVDATMCHVDLPSGMDLLPQLQKVMTTNESPWCQSLAKENCFAQSLLLSRDDPLLIINQWSCQLIPTWCSSERHLNSKTLLGVS